VNRHHSVQKRLKIDPVTDQSRAMYVSGLPFRRLFTEHFGDEKDDNGSEKPSAAEQVNERIAGGREHGDRYNGNHTVTLSGRAGDRHWGKPPPRNAPEFNAKTRRRKGAKAQRRMGNQKEI
jgi:hypothetical protein